MLIADDDREIVDGLALRLKSAGYDTIFACDGEQAVTSAHQRRPDAIILDVRMPRMDGLAALSRLKADAETRDIPVMMVSASVQDRIAALDSGARFFLSKPYQAKSMLEALRSITFDHRPTDAGSA